MNCLQNITFKRKLAIVICAFFACIATVFAIVFPHIIGSALSEPVAVSAGKSEERSARHNYSSVTAELYSGNVNIFIGLTTPADLKQNLNVVGTFSVSGSYETASVMLLPYEYSLSLKSGNNSIALNENEPIFTQALSGSDNVVFEVSVKYGNESAKTATFEFNAEKVVSADNAAPVYTVLSIEPLKNISTDYTNETLKLQSGLTVKGDGEIIYNREFYTVSALGNLILNGNADFVVTYTSYVIDAEGAEPTRNTVTGNFNTGTVIRPNMLAASLQAKPDAKFVANMSRSQILGGLELTVYYEHSERVLSLEVSASNDITSATGETVRFDNGWNNLDSPAPITLSLTVSAMNKDAVNVTKTVSVSITLSENKVVKIAIGRNGSSPDQGDEYSSPTLTPITTFTKDVLALDGYLWVTYESGSVSKITDASLYNISGSFAPDAKALKNGQDNFVKNIKVYYVGDTSVYTDVSVSITRKIGDVSIEPTSVGTFGGVLAEQTFKRGIDLSGLTIKLLYNYGDIEVDAPLTDFIDDENTYVRVIYYDAKGAINYAGGVFTPDNSFVFNKDIVSVRIQFRYLTAGDWTENADVSRLQRDYVAYTNPNTALGQRKLTINNLPLPIPTLDSMTAVYSQNLAIPVTFNYLTEDDSAYEASKDVIENILNGGNILIYDANGSPAGTKVTYGDESFKFTESGTYYIHIKIHSDDAEEVQWNTTTSGGSGLISFADSNNTVIYQVEITRGPIDVKVKPAKTEWTYGEFNPDDIQILIETQSGGSFTVVNGETDNSSEVWLPYKITYIRYDKTTNTGTPCDYPKEAGTYFVQVEIFVTNAYLGGTSPEPDYVQPQFGAPSITIIPKELDTSEIKEITYDGTAHTIGEFLSSSGFVTGTITYTYYENGETDANGNFVKKTGSVNYADSADGVLTYSDGTALSTKQYVKAQEYEITLKINSANYGWKQTANEDEALKDVTLEIFARRLELKVENDGSFDFTYGGNYDLSKLKFTYADYVMRGGAYVLQTSQNSVFADFFAVLETPVFYEKDGFVFNESTGKVTSGTQITQPNSSEWLAGTYYVVYTTSLKSSDDAGDYNLPAAYAQFTVKRKAISRVQFMLNGSDADNANSDYDATAKEFTLANTANYWLASEASILSVTVDGVAHNGTTKIPADSIVYTQADGVSDGTFTIKHAGVYTVVIEITNQNYMWDDGSETNSEFAYTINQLAMRAQSGENPVDGDTFNWGGLSFTYNPDKAQYPVPFAIGLAGSDNDNLTLTAEYYDSTGKVIAKENIVAAGSYTVKITAWEAEGEGWTAALNYKDDGGLSATFTIQSSSLNIPQLKAEAEGVSGNRVTVIYKGAEYDFTDYIDKYGDNSEDGYTYGDGLHKITVSVSSQTNSNGVNVSGGTRMTDVCVYTVSVTPATNFEWKVEKNGSKTYAVEFTFEIEPKQLETSDFEWFIETDNNFENALPDGKYTGYIFNNSQRGLLSALKQSALLGADSRDTVQVTVIYDAEARKDAGKVYTATANRLEGSRQFNYSMPSVKSTQSFEIQQKVLNVPTVTVPDRGDVYDGTERNATVNLQSVTGVTGFDWASVAQYSVTHMYKFESVSVDSGTIASGVSVTNGVTYKNAGEYTVTFSHTDSTNYKWADGASLTATFTIERKSITAPALGENRIAYQYNGDIQAPVLNDADRENLPEFTVSYGAVSDYNSTTQTAESSAYGTYFIKLQIADSENPLNYVWVNNGADNEFVSGILGSAGWGKAEYTQAQVSIYLHYAITGQILTINVNTAEESFTFGDNGYYTDTDGNTHGPKYVLNGASEGQLNFVIITADEADGSKDIFESNKNTVNYTFYRIDELSWTMAQGLANGTEYDGSGTDYIVNGLPWNAGKYGVYVKIDFENDTYADKELWATFEIKQKDVEFKWTAADGDVSEDSGIDSFKVVYDGKEHTLNATAINVPKRAADGEPAVIVLNDIISFKDVKIESGNVAGYTVTGQLSADGNFSSNYNKATLSVTQRPVSVKGIDVNGHVYGNGYDVGKLVELLKNIVLGEGDTVYEIFDADVKNGNAVIDVAKAGIGNYSVVPKLRQDKTNYKLEDVENGNFEIVAREIQLVLDSESGLYRTYGTEYDNTPVYTVEWLNKGELSDENWLAAVDLQNKDNIFTVASGAFEQFAYVGLYNVTVTVGSNSNYEVCLDVDGFEWEKAYEIKSASLKNINVTPADAITYDGKAHGYIGELLQATADATNSEANKLHWYIAEKTDGFAEQPPAADINSNAWTDVTDKTETDAFSGEYWVMVYASNHSAVIYAVDGVNKAVTISIGKATLTVQLNLEIYYGEASPTGYAGENSYFLGNASDLSNSHYTVTDNAGNRLSADDIKNIVGLKGNITYVTDYINGGECKYYALELTVNVLESKNYTFVAATDDDGQTSSLTVKQLPVTVTFETDVYSVTYWEWVDSSKSINDVYSKLISVRVTAGVKSTYDENISPSFPDSGDICKVLVLTILKDGESALVFENNRVSSMGDVGEYAVWFDADGFDKNYDVTLPSSYGTFVITNATITDMRYGENQLNGGEFTALSADYKEEDYVYDTLIYFTAKNYGNVNNASQDTRVYVEYAVNPVNSDSITEWNNYGSFSRIDADTYHVYYKIHADNHNEVIVYQKVTINQVSNSFKSSLRFSNNKNYDKLDNSENFDAAWVYGQYNSLTHTEGYASDGAQKLIGAQVEYSKVPGSGASNFVKYYLFNGFIEAKDIDTENALYSLTEERDVNEWFAELFNSGIFNKGDYTVYYIAQGNTNYSDVSAVMYFKVAPKNLVIKAEDKTVTYGNELETVTVDGVEGEVTYGYTVAGLVNNGVKDETVCDVFNGGALPVFTSTYQLGNEHGSVGEIQITLSNANELISENYAVELEASAVNGWLTVTARRVTLSVTENTVKYNYNAASGTADKERPELEYTDGNERFIESDGQVIELVTNAVVGSTTNDAGVYPVFAYYTDSKHVGNYEIEFAGTVFNSGIAETADRQYRKQTGYYYGKAQEYFNELASKFGNCLIGGTDGQAGVYNVEAANLALNPATINYIDGNTYKPYSDVVGNDDFAASGYDGYEKVHITTPRGSEVSGDVYAVYSTVREQIENLDISDLNAVNALAKSIKDAGTYYYKFVIDNPNYIWTDSSYYSIEIAKRVLNWEINLTGRDEPLNRSNAYSAVYSTEVFELTYAFNRLIKDETLNGDNADVQFEQKHLFDSAFSTYALGASGVFASDNLFKVTALNAGIYSVVIALDSSLNSCMRNYTFVSSEGGRADVSDGKIQFTFTVNRAKHTVSAANGVSKIQYGSLFNANGSASADGRFNGFELDSATLAIIIAEGTDRTDRSGVTYSVFYLDNGREVYYDASNSKNQGETYRIRPDGLKALNYTFDYGSGSYLTVIQRNIDVTVNGYLSETLTPWASVEYNGTNLQPDLSSYVRQFFTFENGWYGEAEKDNKDNDTLITALSLQLTKSEEVDAKLYTLEAIQRSSSTNYKITFYVTDGNVKVPFGEAAEDLLPKFNVRKKPLTVQAGLLNAANGAYNAVDFTEFEVTYGNMLIVDGSYYYFTVRYDGFIAEDGNVYECLTDKVSGSLVFTAKDASGNVYAEWRSRAGMIYTVAPEGLDFTNYEVTYKNAHMTVISRLVTATVSDRVYTEITAGNNVNYNGGVSGIEHNAQIIFYDNDPLSNYANGVIYYSYVNGEIVTDALGNILYNSYAEYEAGKLPPAPNNHISLRYNGVGYNGIEYIDSETAPAVAGEYRVTVTLLNNGAVVNAYDFLLNAEEQRKVAGNKVSGEVSDKTVTFDYTVAKKRLNVTVDTATIKDFTPDKEQVRTVDNFINDIMTISSIINVYPDADGQSVTDRLVLGVAGSLAGNQYAIRVEEHCLDINVYGIGLYTATILFNSNAMYNYEWLDSDDEQFALSFRVAASSFNITSLVLKYDSDGEETVGSWSYGSAAPEPEFEIDIFGVKVVLTYRYAKLYALPDIDGLTFGSMIVGATERTFEGKRDRYSLTVPTAAGIYVLYASYPGSDTYSPADAYLVFEIEKAVISSPEIVSGSLETTYTGEELGLEMSYNTAQLNISYAGTMSVSDRGMILHATNVKDGGYAINFNIIDTDNYTWAEDAVSSFVWVIRPAEDNEVTVFDVSMLADVTYSGNAVELPVATAKYGNSGLRIEFFADNVWTESIPSAAGTYKVRAVSPATENYYNGTAGSAAYSVEFTFVIKRAKLTVTPSGTAEYGTPFNKDGGGSYRLNYSGFVAGSVGVAGNAEYSLVSIPDKLNVNTYALTLITETETSSVDGLLYTVVKGLSADNYYIVVEEGEFQVTAKPLYIAVGNVGAVYGDELNLSGASLTVISGNFVYGETVASLNVTFDIDDEYKVTSGKYPVGFYMMSADYDNANYSVVFGAGIYTVRALDIRIEIIAENGVYGKQAPTAQVTNVVTDDGRKLSEIEGIIVPTFTFRYYGVSNDGQWNYSELNAQENLPTLAGLYIAKAVGTVTSNFNLVTTPAVSFTIEKQELDASTVTVRTEYFNGEPITPYVNPNELSDKYSVVAVEYTNVGIWDVTLVLKDFHNYKWLAVDVAERVIPFTIEKGENSFVADADGGEVTIAGWTFGQNANSPSAVGKFGNPSEFIYEYSDAEDGTYTANVPTTAGTWWVRVTAPQSDNYNRATSSPVSFEIAKSPLAAPSLTIVSDGDGQNVVYSGARLESAVNNFEPATMRIIYAGDISSVGSTVTVFAVNAGTYKVLFALNDSDNYCWADGVRLEDGNALLEWTIARKKLQKPVADEKMFMVNGGTLTYMPVGFDENTMNIEGNKISYGGLFKVTVSLKDTVNYEWADSSVEDITFDWVVVGWDTVFIIVVSVLGAVAGISAIAIGVQYIVHRRKKVQDGFLEASTPVNGNSPEDGAASVGRSDAKEESTPEKNGNTAKEKAQENRGGTGNE